MPPSHGLHRGICAPHCDKSIEEIPVVREFPDVFPDDLPGMLPERDIKFKIELQLDTTPISKAPYKMS
jgi:hypothetical protein